MTPPTPSDLSPIGQARTPWSRGNCPKNMNAARETGTSAHLLIDPPYRPGLLGLDRASHIILLGWFTPDRRDLLRLKPAHLKVELGCFALRAPARPNPIALSIAKIVGLDTDAGRVELDALDWFDGTPVLDIKPYYASTDAHPEARIVEPG